MTAKERCAAWAAMPQQMRKEITDLYRAYWTTFNTRRRLEEIFGRDNLNHVEIKAKYDPASSKSGRDG